MFKKKKKKETEEELKAKLAELKGEEEEGLDVLPELPKPPKPKTAKAKPEPTGEFSLNSGEMALAVNALASSEEFKVYQQMVIGQQIAEIIGSYNKAIEEKSEVQSSEDTDEGLPTE